MSVSMVRIAMIELTWSDLAFVMTESRSRCLFGVFLVLSSSLLAQLSISASQ